MAERNEQSLVVDQWGKADLVQIQFQAAKLRGIALRRISVWLARACVTLVRLIARRIKARRSAMPRGVAWSFIQATSNRGSRQA